MVDSPVAAYQVKQNNGAIKLVGESYNFKPYGIAIPKHSGMAAPMLAALKLLRSNGTYGQILTKWGIQSGAISTPKINGAIS
jgi:polar amino acid transport system substrate-binding protein